MRTQLQGTVDDAIAPEEQPGCASRDDMRASLRVAVTALMDSLHLDALVYRTWRNPPRLIGDLNTRTATTVSGARHSSGSRP